MSRGLVDVYKRQGPCFGMKGGAAGGGYAQVVPMEEINLHFTGDFHAITAAHNLLSSLIDNHIYWGNELQIDQRRITWGRVVDLGDRSLRKVNVNLGGVSNGFPREDKFDITVASEIMAIFCLANDINDLQKRIGDIIIAYKRDKSPIYARDVKADGPMTVLLKNALMQKYKCEAGIPELCKFALHSFNNSCLLYTSPSPRDTG